LLHPKGSLPARAGESVSEAVGTRSGKVTPRARGREVV